MKQVITILFTLGSIPFFYGQTFQCINSGAVSNNNLIYSVGDIYVIPTNPNEASSGLIGAITRYEFTSLGINEVVSSEKIKFYPNPTSNSVFFETENKEFNSIYIYDLNGRLLYDKKVSNNQVDLSDLRTGTYLIKTDNQNIQSFKIIKK